MFTTESKLARITTALLFAVLAVYVLTVAKDFLLPLFLSVLISYLLFPLASQLEKWKVPRIAANLISILVAIAVLTGAGFFIYSQVNIFVQDFPQLKQQALENVDRFQSYIQNEFGFTIAEQNQWLKARINEIFATSGSFLTNLFTSTAGTAAKIALLPIYVFFMLYYRDKFREFLIRLIPEEGHQKTDKVIDEISAVTTKYMGGVFIVVLILCVLNSVGLMIVGLKYAILLGILSALMNFIPYFGTLLGALFPLLFALLTTDSFGYVIGVIILFAIIQFTENNILTPNITGGQVNINPFITILSLIAGGMIWGVWGMFLAIPTLGMFKVLSEHVPSLQAYNYLIGTGGTEGHALTWGKIKAWFRKKKK